MTIDVRVTPRSSRTRVALEGDVLRVWVTAPPTDGQANDAVCRAVAEALGIAPSRVQIVRGGTSRTKRLEIEGVEPQHVFRRLSGS